VSYVINENHEDCSARIGRDDGRQECGDALSEQDLSISSGSCQEGFQALLNLFADYAVRGARIMTKKKENEFSSSGRTAAGILFPSNLITNENRIEIRRGSTTIV